MKIAIFIPYFVPEKGQLPNYFEFWQKSAANNSGVDFYIPTNADVKQYKTYKNIFFLEMKVEEYFQKVKKICGFDIVHNCYKIGEYRPLCGLMFEDILNKYDYWGYSELDLIYGDILKFISQYLRRGEDVIGRLGHFRLIKNCIKLNELPFVKINPSENLLTIQQAFQTMYCCHFDEVQGMGVRYFQNKVHTVDISGFIADIDQKYKYYVVLNRRGKWYFKWENGVLSGYNKDKSKDEFIYVHFQKRRLQLENSEIDKKIFYMANNEFANSISDIRKLYPNTFFYTIRNRKMYYQKLKDDREVLESELRAVIEYTNAYCRENKLFN